MTDALGSRDKERLYDFAKGRRHAVIATANSKGQPEAALINIAVTSDLEIVFETTSVTRKFVNLQSNPRVSLVIGWDNDQTLQCDGLVDEPDGRDLGRLKALYISTFPTRESQEFWPGNGYFRVRPQWVRLSNYYSPRKIEEFLLPVDERLYPALKRTWWQRIRLPRKVSRQRN